MINADSEKRRKTLIRVHLSTAPEAKWSLVNRIKYHTQCRVLVQGTCTVVYSKYQFSIIDHNPNPKLKMRALMSRNPIGCQDHHLIFC